MANLNVNYDINSLSSDTRFNLLNILAAGSASEKNVFFEAEPESPYDSNNFDCKYIAAQDLDGSGGEVSLLSINIQSLQAKFADLRELIGSTG